MTTDLGAVSQKIGPRISDDKAKIMQCAVQQCATVINVDNQ